VARFLDLTIEGKENLKIMKKQGCIVISNHCHYFDTVFANVFIYPEVMHTSVAQRNFEVPIIRRILRIIRCFPIPARKDGLEMIRKPVGEALKRLRNMIPAGPMDTINICYMFKNLKTNNNISYFRHEEGIHSDV
jgi:1-acyl-sn-glycerol-3-phosphate acyltransferase